MPHRSSELARIEAATDEAIRLAADHIRQGELVAFPTETVYGLGADATRGQAVAAIYEAKGRPSFNPLIAHVDSIAMAERLVVFDPLSRRLAETFWPGPLTLVLPARPDCPVSSLATAGLDTLAVRMPSHRVALDLIRAAGVPIVAPSANTSGHVSPTSAAHVYGDLSRRVPLILDGGRTEVGLESTILQVRDGTPYLLRPGGLAREEIEAATGIAVVRSEGDPSAAPVAPGMLASHYAPRARVRLDARRVEPREALLAFGGAPIRGIAEAARVFNLSPSGNLREAAANLFDMLRRADGDDVAGIAVAPIPTHGLGEAIRDRLRRAAAPR
ncbi:L-threonylcarbamoyladenylate synthase [Pleomorphomonas carboxyditropha]|uniref:L-threonylcarbamoyladenylate synthase n=1 Tax=Pleomorphomonas carboxyditropha TaxID=2023338 RepID=UPI001FE0C0EC|nr:L-threonylcarbamoyladenylate synthase [Pleomorphomonas carboxyditropha]